MTAPTAPERTIRDMLMQHARGEVDVDGMMRELMGFDDWLVPIAFLAAPSDGKVHDGLVMYSQQQRLPPGELWLFTDRAAADRVAPKWATLGSYVTGVSTLEWVEPLMTSGLKIVKVNPGGTRQEYWGIQSGGFEIAASWARGVAIEKGLRKSGTNGDADLAALMERHTTFVIPLSAGSQRPITAVDRDGETLYCCLTEDAWKATYQALSAEREVLSGTTTLAGLRSVLTNNFPVHSVCFQPFLNGGRHQVTRGRSELMRSRVSGDVDLTEVRAFLAKGQLIGAIKVYRELTGVGLADAKKAVEEMR